MVEAMVRDVVERLGRLDILVNNAGIISTALIEEVNPEEWGRIMDVNLKGVFHTCKTCLKVMLPRCSGKIVNMSSRPIGGAGWLIPSMLPPRLE